ncbi:MAG TPA: alpha/beta fold hydrolase [Candidatus Acidoferrum sp.]|nr:alpha/beta fold hydrolase [Candidatus Acidoferrum sp.]
MNRRGRLEAAAGVLLCALGYGLAHRDSYEVRTVLATAGGCQMATDIYEPRSGPPQGSVVLFHGLAANKKVMSFTAQEFANQELRVFVPDLPGHGRTPGPYSATRADSCADAFLRNLVARKAIAPERTILGGHSLGGAIAIRAARAIPVAGVIAISPAPMQAVPGFSEEMILFHDAPPLPPHSLVLTGQWEPGPIKLLGRRLVASASDSSSRYQLIPGTSHVSILFSAGTFLAVRAWTAQLLGTSPDAPFPRNMPALASILGIAGLAILVPPFLREANTRDRDSAVKHPLRPSEDTPPFFRGLLLSGLAGVAAALVLASRFIPVRFVGLVHGDYLAVFLFLSGLLILAGYRKSLPPWPGVPASPLAATCASALVLVLLYAGWFELTFYEAWLTPARWLRFPLLLLLVFPWQLAEEILLGRPASSPDGRRLAKAFALRALVYVPMFAGIRYFHSGAVLLFLLLAYFVVFSLLQRLACDLVRFRTQSPAAAAIFGAILLAAFALAIFPVA